MTSGVTDKDNGYKALTERIQGAKNLVLTVGVHGDDGSAAHEEESGSSGPLTVADVATIHEYGLGHNPERSFIRGWADQNHAQNTEVLRKIGQAVVKGNYSAQQGLERAGNLFVAQIQNRIVAGIAPPLDPATIKRKGSSTPLINTSQMKNTIRYRVTIEKL